MQIGRGRAMKRLVKEALDRVGLLNAVLRTRWNIKRGFGWTDRALIEKHLLSSPVRKLQLGCGFNKLPGWLNSDLFPPAADVWHLDVTSVFPLPSDTFDFIYSEHMIEHIPYTAGQVMLEECYRVLKPGGTIRVSTPDLNFVVGLYQGEKSDLQKAYIKWLRRARAPPTWSTISFGIGAISLSTTRNRYRCRSPLLDSQTSNVAA
jgi:SAM-dependent methyltransferase